LFILTPLHPVDSSAIQHFHFPGLFQVLKLLLPGLSRAWKIKDLSGDMRVSG